MAANYGSIASHQVGLVADTAAAVTLPTTRTAQTRVTISAPYRTGASARTAPVHFIFRNGGSTEPTTLASGSSGAVSPMLPAGVAAIDIEQIPGDATQLVLESIEGGDVWVQFYEAAL